MAFFNSGFFWFIEGVLAFLTILALKIWAEDKKIPMPFWKWPIVIAWLLFICACVAYVGTSIGEGETSAALMGTVFGFVIIVISGVIVWRFIKLR